MSNNRLFQYGKHILLIILMLATLIFLNIAVQNNNTAQENKQKDMSKLNVAVVNEDASIVDKNGQEYNLGASYVKKLEKDESNNWTITSRGAAENGLKGSKYQLLVVIPSDFSSKVLDIDSLTANRALVTYRVNSNGNNRVESQANRLGSQIVADLNSQLVNMYMASILENLYLAQQNVLVLSGIQIDNIGAYSNNIYQSALGFQDDFKPLLSIAQSSLSANDNLLASLRQSHASQTERRLPSKSSSSDSTIGPSATRQAEPQNTVSPAETAETTIAMTNEDLARRLQVLLGSIQKNQKLLDESTPDGAITSENLEEGQTRTYSQLVNNLQTQIDELDGELKTLEEQNKAQAELVSRRISEKIHEYYGKEKDTNISLRDFLKKNKGQSDIDSIEAQQTTVQNIINKLPSLDTAVINENMKALSDKAAAFKYTTYANQYYGAGFKGSELGTRLAEAKDKLEKSLSNVTGKSNQVTYHYNNSVTPSGENNNDGAREANPPETESSSSAAEVPESPTRPEGTPIPAAYVRKMANERATRATIAVSAPDIVSLTSVTVNGQPVTNGGMIDLVESSNAIAVSFDYKTVAKKPNSAQNISITVTPNQGSAVTQTIPVDLSPYVDGDYMNAVEEYAAVVQEVQDVYATAEAVIESTSVTNAAGEREPLQSVLDKNISDYLQDLVSSSLTVAYGGSETATVANLKETKKGLEGNLALLKNVNNEELSKNIEELLSRIDGVSGINERESSRMLSPADSDTEPSPEELSSLQEDTSALAERSAQDVSRAEGVNSTFQTFKSNVETTQKNSSALSVSAEDLMNKFNKELEENGSFVDAFSKVFGNAYNNGVANEVLLDFLSKPVKESSHSVQATANVYRPFTWIILLAIVTLFAAYVFGTQDIFQRVKDKFKLSAIVQADIVSILLMTGLSVVIGIILGSVSASQLSIGQAAVPSWIFLNIVLSIILVLGQYLVIRQFRVLGMGLSLLMLISYIYVTNAIGTTVSVGGSLALVKRLNFLTYVERLFSSFFSGDMIGLGTIFILLLLIVALVAVNILIPSLKEKLNKGV